MLRFTLGPSFTTLFALRLTSSVLVSTPVHRVLSILGSALAASITGSTSVVSIPCARALSVESDGILASFPPLQWLSLRAWRPPPLPTDSKRAVTVEWPRSRR